MKTARLTQILILVTAGHLLPTTGIPATFHLNTTTRETAPPNLPVTVTDVQDATTFYAPLAPHGRWMQDPALGLVWQPTVVRTNPSWRPYCNDGQWIWTDQGWYWQSTLAWGWAPFHYGRWYPSPHHGWLWVPGTTWAPAWVDWRESDDYYGWAPLPPTAQTTIGFGLRLGGSSGISINFGLSHDHYVFVERSRFLSSNLSLVMTSRRHCPDLYHRSVVVHHGFPVASVGTACHRSVRSHHIVLQRHGYSRSTPIHHYRHTPAPVYRPPVVVHRSVPYRPPTRSISPSHGRSTGSYRHTTPAPARVGGTSRSYHQPSRSPAPAPTSSHSGSSRVTVSRSSGSTDSPGRRSNRLKSIVKKR